MCVTVTDWFHCNWFKYKHKYCKSVDGAYGGNQGL